MKAWQKREVERKKFLEKLHRETINEPGDGDEIDDDENILRTAKDLLEAVIYDMGHENRSKYPITREIDEFAKTKAESMVLKRELLSMLIQSGFHGAESEYLRERIHEQEKLYDGHRAMDDVE